MTREIPVSPGRVALVDDEDYPLLSQNRWCLTAHRYAMRAHRIDGKLRAVLMHRQIMEAVHGREVDHINGNGLDNRRSNLRLVSHMENQRNKNRKRTGSSRFKGVSFDRKRVRWAAQIGGRIGHKHLGRFHSEEEAARAYDKAARQYFGEYARLNFPDEVN